MHFGSVSPGRGRAPYGSLILIPLKTTLFRTLQSALALAEAAGVAHRAFRGIVEPPSPCGRCRKCTFSEHIGLRARVLLQKSPCNPLARRRRNKHVPWAGAVFLSRRITVADRLPGLRASPHDPSCAEIRVVGSDCSGAFDCVLLGHKRIMVYPYQFE